MDSGRAWWIAAALVLLPAVAGAAEPGSAEPRRLSFAEAVRVAAGETPAARIAGLKADQAQARLSESRGAFLPSLSGSASEANRTTNIATFGIEFPSTPGAPPQEDLIGPFDVFDTRIAASQTLFDWSSWMKIRAARQDLAASRADHAASSEGAAHDAALAYLRAARAEAMLEARGEDLLIADTLLTVAKIQVDAGVSPNIDVTRARTQHAVSRGGILVARNQVDRTQIDLARALGLDPTSRFALTDTLSPELGAADVPSDPPAALAAALERRPELRAEVARGLQARADRSAIGAERLPRLAVDADYGLSGRHPGDAIATREVMVGVSMPLFDGLRRESRIQEQSGVVRESELRARDVRDRIGAEVSLALLDLGSGLEQERVAMERLHLAEDELAQARERFVSGVAGNIEVIDAQSGLVQARDAEIEARFAIAVARVNLAQAAGVAQTLR